MAGPDLLELARVARRAAEAPGEMIATAARQQSFDVETKSDGSYLTRVDEEAERMVRDILRAENRPAGAAIIGEEQGEEGAGAPWRWVVDPIDGTHPFTRDLPVFGTVVALQEMATGEVVVGAIHLPSLGETAWAARGCGAFRDDAPIRVSGRTELAGSMLSVGTPYQFRRSGVEHLYPRLFDAVDGLRAFGDCFAHVAAARGALDAVFDPDLSLWDFAASKVIVAEAGGTVLVRETGRGRGHDVLLGTPAIVETLAELLEF